MAKETTIENATIESTSLGKEDHGVMTAFLICTGDGWGCGFGGYALDSYNSKRGRRIGCAFGMEFIVQVLDVVGVSKWEDLKGKHVRMETEGLGGGIKRIGHITKNKWFDPQELAETMKTACEPVEA